MVTTRTKKAQTEKSPIALTVRQFTLEFLGFFGASVRRLNRRKLGAVHAELPPSLAERFGKTELTLVFRSEDLNDGAWDGSAELVAIGSRAFDTMCSHLAQHGALTVLKLPAHFGGGGDELLQAVRPLNASVTNLKMQEQMHELYLFDWRISYRADDKREEIYTVALDDSGTRVLLDESVGNNGTAPELTRSALLADGEPVSPIQNEDGQFVPPRLPPMTQLVRLAESARKYAIYHADVRCVEHETEVQTRLYKTLGRLHTYYSQQIQEVYDAHDPEGEKRGALEADLQRKLAEEVENHRLRVDVRLISYAILQLPVAVADLTLHDGKRETELRIRRNRYTGALRRPACHACAQEVAALAIDRNGHITCDDCLQQCESCADILCAECGVEPCPVCQRSNCDTCGQFCWACGERACAEHVSRCPVCQDAVCHACQAECASCGERQCRTHLRADSVLRVDGAPALVCAECAVRCPGCRQYSSQTGTCAASGQRFCTGCLVACAGCDRVVGPGFYHEESATGRAYCQECVTLCPSCQTPAPTTHACHECEASCCDACSASCAQCGVRCCAEHSVRDTSCEHVFCAEHSVQCGVQGESVCPICRDTCAICERHFCANHTATCKLCRCTYCSECVRSQLGLCDTCATVQRYGEPLYLSEEPVASHPDVAPLVEKYNWSRTGNLRYTIYIGWGPHNTGALVLVQKEPGLDEAGEPEDPVLVAREFKAMDAFWKKY